LRAKLRCTDRKAVPHSGNFKKGPVTAGPLSHKRPSANQAPDRPAEAAAVNAIANGSQHNTMRAISHRMARSLSAFAPTKLGHAEAALAMSF
jgi:hypothetical protein